MTEFAGTIRTPVPVAVFRQDPGSWDPFDYPPAVNWNAVNPAGVRQMPPAQVSGDPGGGGTSPAYPSTGQAFPRSEF